MTKLEKLRQEKVGEFEDNLGYILSTKAILKSKHLANHSLKYIDIDIEIEIY